METFDDDVALLHQIPVFPALLKKPNAAAGNGHHNGSSESMLSSAIMSSSPVTKTYPHDTSPITLLDWINSRGTNQSLEQVADSCYRTLEALDEQVRDKFAFSPLSLLSPIVLKNICFKIGESRTEKVVYLAKL